MRSLYWKLGAALLLVVVVSVGLTAYLANISTEREFQSYVQQGTTMYARNISSNLGQYYLQNYSWTGVQNILADFLRSSSDRLIVADNTGLIVGDTGGIWLGKNSADAGLTGGTSILSSGQSVGTLYVLTTSMVGSKGYMGGRGSSTSISVSDPEQNFLDSINRSLIIAGLIGVAVALLLGLFLTRQIVKPIRALTIGASHIASGDLKYRVVSKTRDEVGTLAQSFNTMASNLERSEEARRQLNADIAHELRTPLTIIEGTVDGIMDGVFQPDKERLSTIKDQTALLTRLINDLRELSLIESGQLKLDLKSTDIADLVQHKISQIEATAREKSIHLEFKTADRLPEVLIDPAGIEQVLSNLLTNAIRHTPVGGNITLSLSEVNEDRAHQIDNPSIILSVSDNGEGIAPEHLPYIFERFYRVEKSRTRSEGGSGLGLAIVKQIVQAHGGKVWVESEMGKGSNFYVALPMTGNS